MLFLVIDDDELSRELLAMLLGMEGYEVEVAASGEEALARLSAAERPSPDVILSDMQMPGLSGEPLARTLRGATGDRTKLLAMSGSQPPETALRRFDGFLLKPFSMVKLDAALRQIQEKRNILEDATSGTGGDNANLEASELNEEIYAKMAKMMPAKQLGELYGMCLADARERLGLMGTLADAGDDDGYRKAAHKVKGGCGMIGATELYKLAEQAEMDGVACHSGPGSQALLERFADACDRLERILKKR